MIRKCSFLSLFGLLFAASLPEACAAEKTIQMIPLASPDAQPIVPATTAIIANRNDPASMTLAAAYARTRGIPGDNIIWVSLPIRDSVSEGEIQPALDVVRKRNDGNRFRAYAIAWQKPYRLKNQSITAAFSMGLSHVRFSGNCNLTDLNPLYEQRTGEDLSIPVSMMLVGGPDAADSMELVQNAGTGDGLNPKGTAYFLRTDDAARSSPRLLSMAKAAALAQDKIKVVLKDENELSGADDILVYETGKAVLPQIASLSFRPGGYADSLTSFAGRLTDSHGQTTVLAIMKAGATGSFGTVREPCNYEGKFPRSDIMLDRYLSGDSLVEAYWKSVRMVTEALFVGEPLSRPFAIFKATKESGVYKIVSTRLSKPGRYQIYSLGSGKPVYLADFTMTKDVPPGTVIALIAARGQSQHEENQVLGFLAVSTSVAGDGNDAETGTQDLKQ